MQNYGGARRQGSAGRISHCRMQYSKE